MGQLGLPDKILHNRRLKQDFISHSQDAQILRSSSQGSGSAAGSAFLASWPASVHSHDLSFVLCWEREGVGALLRKDTDSTGKGTHPQGLTPP